MRFRAASEADLLYDCHAAKFREVRKGVNAASGFLPLFVARLFGVAVREWHGVLQLAHRELAARGVEAQEAWLAEHGAVTSLGSAAEVALLAYPEMEGIVHRVAGERGPFGLEERFLFQENVELGWLEGRGDGGWRPVWRRGEGPASAVRESLVALAAGSGHEVPPAGTYVIGHSGVLVRGETGGIVIDPVVLGALAGRRAVPVGALRRAATAVALTHGHFDHYHLPTLLALSELTAMVPRVPRATVVCEDIARRLEEFGVPGVMRTEWGQRIEVDDLVVHVLPFVGEQFLVNEVHPDVRNWGQCYVVEAAGRRTMVLADSGFEKGRDVFGVVEGWVAENGAVDVVICQSIALRPSFASGDPDLQLTGLLVPHRAVDALRLQRPEERVTLAVEDLPRLCRAAGAKVLVPHGQFGFDVGSPAVGEKLLADIRTTMASSCPDVRVEAVAVGAGLRATDLSRVTWLS